ncbi:MAG TPA: O-methyltransferase [Candidatus Limnocylindria bacterium]|nr:O-methyltransferase [Candidatus Limnocylindria bacterium]
MPGILESHVEKYLDRMLPKRDAVLAEMEKYASRRKIPIIGPGCGRLLHQLAQISGARRMFEMGSAIGYSTIWLARGAGADAEIYYTDGDPENARRARDNFRRGGVEDRIQLLVGDAVQLIDGVPGAFDLIFIDVDKQQYPAALRKAVPRLRSGGLLITDNVLWYGRASRRARDARTRAIQQFNRMIYSSSDLFPVIVPLRDGVAVCRKS